MKTPLRFVHQAVALFTFAALTSGLFGVNFASAAEVLKFRLPKSKSMHLKDEATAKSYEKSLKTLGVSSKLHGHDGHFDLSVACPEWRKAEFKTHAEVEKWTKWLSALGFETQHQH